jgi:hypothetical protein
MAREGTFVRFVKSGGFAGITDQLEILGDGQASVTTKQSKENFRLDEATMARLRTELDGVDFAGLSSAPVPKTSVRDGFFYAITYDGHEVKRPDDKVEKELLPIVKSLDDILRQHGGWG